MANTEARLSAMSVGDLAKHLFAHSCSVEEIEPTGPRAYDRWLRTSQGAGSEADRALAQVLAKTDRPQFAAVWDQLVTDFRAAHGGKLEFAADDPMWLAEHL